MKIRFFIILAVILPYFNIWAQSVPQGINYQAVARDVKGIPMANQEINLKISLLAGDAGGKAVYEETHDIQSGALGMFSLVVGKGKTLRGDFTQVPWSESEIWIEIAIDEKNSGTYTPLSTSQLMAVPYALHAGTADDIPIKAGSGRADLAPSAFWKVNGNNMTIPGSMFLGTIDCKDLVFKTNSISRMSITCTGIVDIGGNLFVGGTFNAAGIVNFTNSTQSTNINNGAVIIDGGLGVEKNVNIGGTLCVDGVTNLKNTTQSNTKDDGSLVVEGGVGIEKNINIGGNSNITGNSNVTGNSDVGGDLAVNGIGTFLNKAQSTTINNGSLIVDGGAGIELNLNVGGNTEVDGTLGVDSVTTLKNTTESSTKDNGSLVVEGGAGIEKNLNVGGNSGVTGSSTVGGIATFNNTTESTTKDNGAVVIEGGVGVEKNLNVGGNSAVTGNSTVGGTLGVTNAATFSSSVNVNGITTLANTTQSTTFNNGALIMDGGAGIEKNLNVGGNTEVDGTLGVDGVTTLRNNLNVSKDDGSFVATITNTNNNTGDGLKIRLGKTHPAWNGSAYLNATSPVQEFFASQVALVRSWIDSPGSFNPTQLITMSPNAHYAGTACTVLNLAIGQVNDKFDNLVLSFPPAGVGNIFGGNNGFQTIFSDIDAALLDVIPDDLYSNLNIPAIPFPSFTLPDIIPNIPSVSCSGLPTFSMPVLSFTNLPGSLTNDNQFIKFEDKDGRSLGSIRAQAVGDWATNYLDGTYITEVMASIVGIDLLQGVAQTISQYSKITKSYNQMGVEYNSGHADYAEWLERKNPNEIISAGDIVGVRGGKVSKSLEGAEQILAVSHNPIMLGNMPSKDKEPYGNKIAFTGQVPVKVVGSVHMGDYIVAKGDISGYGIAIKPGDLTTDDLKLTVGRSWEENLNDGPKMVNTLIGIDNGDYIKIMKESQDKISSLESRMKDIEEKLALLLSNKK